MKNYPLHQWIEGYLSYQKDVCKKGHRSIIDMRCSFKRISVCMDKKQPETPLWKLKLQDYTRWINIERENGKSVKTIQKDISYLRGLLDYSWRAGRCDRNVLDGFNLQDDKEPLIEPVSLSIDEVERLVSTCPVSNQRERKERLVILLLYGCGLRTSELRHLDVQDIGVEKQEIFVRKAKGDRDRYIPVPGELWTEILTYMHKERRRRGALIRTDAKNKRVSSAYICDVVKRSVKRAGLRSDITPRTLRHTFATHLMDAGVNISVISSLMGHRSPRETGVYLHALTGQCQSAVNDLEIGDDE